MSFSSDAKTEVVKSELPQKEFCAMAELSALFRTCGQLGIEEGSYTVELVTELSELSGRVQALVSKLIPDFNDLTVLSEERPRHPTRFRICFPKEVSQKLLMDCFVLKANMEPYTGIPQAVAEEDSCKRSFIKGAFLGCASANIVIKDLHNLKKHTGGYHLEFVFSSAGLSADFAHLLSHYGFNARTVQRKRLWITYIKEAEQVSDMLAFVGANNAVMVLQNEFAVREVRNQLNRQLNCMNSNLVKMVDASLKQIEAIEFLRDTVGLEALPGTLYELCLLRLANPDESYENLAKLMTEPLTKSGVNHRLRKIVHLAEKIKAN